MLLRKIKKAVQAVHTVISVNNYKTKKTRKIYVSFLLLDIYFICVIILVAKN